MKHIIIIILTLLSITINAQGIRLNSKQSVIDSTRLNATGDSLYYYQNGVLLRVEGITGAGGDYWTQTGSDIYYNSGNVGIGTSSPSSILDINGGYLKVTSNGRKFAFYEDDVSAGDGVFEVINATGTANVFKPVFNVTSNDASGTYASGFVFNVKQDNSGQGPVAEFMARQNNTTVVNRDLFRFSNYFSSGISSSALTIKANNNVIIPNGNVGIGTSTPQGFLSVERQFPNSSTLGLTVGDPRYEGVFQIKTSSTGSFMPTFEGYSGIEDATYPIGVVVQGSVDTSKDVSYPTHGLIILQGREYDNFPLGAGPVENAPILTVKNYNNLLMKVEANGNVGIGTSSPSAKLEVSGGDANFDSGTLFVDESADKVGIGTTSPTNLLSVAANFSTEYSSAGGSNPYTNAVLKLQNTNTSATTPFNLIYFRLDKNGGDGYLGFVAGDAVNEEHFIVGNQVNGEIFRIASGGNVGIGTSSPDSKLEVNGSATNTSANNEGSDATIDFSLSNIAYTDNTGNSITLTNIKDGGAYTLISTATNVTSAVAFTVPTGFSIIGMGTVARTNGKQHIYSFIVAGGNVYVTMGTEN